MAWIPWCVVYSFQTDHQFQNFTLDLEILLAAAAFSFPQVVHVSFEPQVYTSCKTQTNITQQKPRVQWWLFNPRPGLFRLGEERALADHHASNSAT